MNLHMRLRIFLALILVFMTRMAISQDGRARGQGAVPGAAAPVPGILPESLSNGQYVIHQSIEVGYRASDTTGSGPMYDTLVDLHGGPRLLEQTLSMQSTTHEGVVFDNAFVNSFGWGGDPDNGLLARFDKKNWYDFRANFRRDQNHFDYNLLANPLNPSTSNPNVPVEFSPHGFATTRRMSDVDLTFLPQSAVTLRFGYSRNNMSGDSYSSVHEGTDALLLQPWNTTLNSYRVGADFKLVPHTVVSYDQVLDYYKGDTFWNLAPFVPALLPGGSAVELGLPIDTVRNTPCAPKGGPALIDAGGTLTNVACSGYFAYHRTDPIRTSTPTERISVHGDYFDRLELNGSYSYSASEMNATLDEYFNGLLSRTRTRQFTVNGPTKSDASLRRCRSRRDIPPDESFATGRHVPVLGISYSREFQCSRNRLGNPWQRYLCSTYLFPAGPDHFDNANGDADSKSTVVESRLEAE